MGDMAETNEVAIMIIARDPSTMRMRSRNEGRMKRAMIVAKNIKIVDAMNTPRIKVFSLPNSLFMERRDTSLRNVFAKAAMGMARKFAN